MAQLNTKIRLYAKAKGVANINFTSDVKLQDDMIDEVSSPYIKEWNLEIAKPTDEQLASYESSATTEQNNEVVRTTRKSAYGDIGDQLDLLYKDMLADKGDKSGEWFKAVKAVKDANPKE